MKHLSVSLVACLGLLARAALAAPGPAKEQSAPLAVGRAHFVDGETLRGSLQSFSPQTGFVWLHPQARAPLLFAANCLRQITFEDPKAKVDDAAEVWLTNGDVLPGRLVSFDADRLVLETLYAGRLTLKRPFVRMLSFHANAPSIQGFGKMGDWQMKDTGRSDGMRILPDKMEINGYTWASREVPFGEQFFLELTGESSSGQTQFSFCLERPLDQQAPPSGYMLMLYQNGVIVYGYNGGNTQMLGHFNAQMPNGRLRTSVIGNACDKTLTIAINGKQMGVISLKKWVNGKFLALGNNGNGTTVYTQLNVTASLPAKPLPTAPAQDALRFANQDRTSGQLLWIKDGWAMVKTPEGELTLPVARLAQVDLAKMDNSQVQAAAPHDAQIFFNAATRMTLQVEKITGNQLVGHGEMLGECTVDMKSVKKLRFK